MIKAIRASCPTDEDMVSCWYGQYCTIRYWHTVRDEAEGKAIRFCTKAEAIQAAQAEWWQHHNGTAQTNRKRSMETCHG